MWLWPIWGDVFILKYKLLRQANELYYRVPSGSNKKAHFSWGYITTQDGSALLGRLSWVELGTPTAFLLGHHTSDPRACHGARCEVRIWAGLYWNGVINKVLASDASPSVPGFPWNEQEVWPCASCFETIICRLQMTEGSIIREKAGIAEPLSQKAHGLLRFTSGQDEQQ